MLGFLIKRGNKIPFAIEVDELQARLKPGPLLIGPKRPLEQPIYFVPLFLKEKTLIPFLARILFVLRWFVRANQ